MKNHELDSTTTARIMPLRKVNQAIHINITDLESIHEIELAKRRDRIEEFKIRNW